VVERAHEVMNDDSGLAEITSTARAIGEDRFDCRGPVGDDGLCPVGYRYVGFGDDQTAPGLVVDQDPVSGVRAGPVCAGVSRAPPRVAVGFGVVHPEQIRLTDQLLVAVPAAGHERRVGAERTGVVQVHRAGGFVQRDGANTDRLPPMSPVEDELLEATASERRADSRLSCQLPVTEDLDGLVVVLPETQE
jgi:hypothetical protein